MTHPEEGVAPEVTEVPSGPLTQDQAAEALSLLDDEIIDGVPVDEDGYEINPPPEPVEDEENAEEPEEEAEETPSFTAPDSWDDEAKELFVSLPPEMQSYIAKRESDRDKGFHEKSQELAEARKASEQAQQRIEAERQYYTQLIQHYAPPIPDRPDPDLLNSDPVEYMRQQRIYEDALTQRQAMGSQLQQLQHQQAEAAKQQHSSFMQEQNALLEKVMPEWTGENAPALRKDLSSYAVGFGYTPERLSQADALDIQVLHKAMQWDALQKSKPTVKDAVKHKPTVQKPGVKSAKGQAAADRRAAKMKQLQRTGSVADAAGLLMDMID